MHSPIWLIAAALAVCAPAVLADTGEWQCATLGIGVAPALAHAASDFLGHAGQVYPSQLLGMVSAGDRVYLVNARDDGWSERVRLGLMELRLAEPDITAGRRFQAAASGVGAMEIPAGDYACLARERAGRHGLALDDRGRMSLAPGKSVHLVDPREWTVVVEVKAVGAEPLDFREILALSGRSGIYAGLTSRRAPPEAGGSVQGAGGVIEVAIGPAGRPEGEVVITPRTGEGETRTDTAVDVAIPAAPPVPATVASAAVMEPPARVAKADVPDALPPAQPLAPQSPPAVTVAAVEPETPVVRLPRASVAQSDRLAAAQSYEDYAKTMKALLAARRSGSVRSVSEMTYVHPAIEDLRNSR
jgi:hypothetical protein